MLRYVLKRLLVFIPNLFVISLLVFFGAREIASPEGQLTLNPRVTAEDKANLVKSLGLDKSPLEQYWKWFTNFLQGDLGVSFISKKPVWPEIESALSNTLALLALAVTFSLMLGILIGAIAAVRQNTLFDYTATGLAFLGISIPVFWLGLMLQLFFALYLQNWLNLDGPALPSAGLYPPGQQGFDPVLRLKHMILPAIALSVQLVGVYSRYMRASMLEVLGSDYLRTARSKGLKERRTVMHHGVRTALIPVSTQAAADIGLLVGGLIITEQIFQYPGMGLLFLDSLRSGDYMVLLPTMLIVAIAVMTMNLLADILYGFLDPRIRYE
jgi:peptide/nickel transport system permease protein